MNVPKVHEAGDAIRKLVDRSFGGHPNDQVRLAVHQLADDARYASAYHPYIEEKVAGLKSLVDILYSQKKHAKYGGPEGVKSRLSHYIHALIHWSPSEASA
jgi:hypothetical protein